MPFRLRIPLLTLALKGVRQVFRNGHDGDAGRPMDVGNRNYDEELEDGWEHGQWAGTLTPKHDDVRLNLQYSPKKLGMTVKASNLSTAHRGGGLGRVPSGSVTDPTLKQ